ncbi:hypothetical protein AAZX31_07G014700 [Glycine max]|uniref:Avr9/Cf-9 rapidly elicited protein n=2 Tax=Glycine max TaxID=3847 RepID=I1KGJ7_SOYBN|nr:hypothetical protein JHK87_017213 [Glycine soja]KAH1240274.1 hypothetical protein GmHk_07G018177 [Glycine max]|eukprot:XP_003529756.3 uncharacterized protein LOC100801941 [Glycine max]
MESNTPVIAKKVLSIIRVAFFMLRKGISKGKLMMHLNNMMLKRPGKAIANLMFHHHHNHGVSGNNLQFSTAREYEFSCSNTPNNFFAAALASNNKRHRHNPFFTCAHAPPTLDDDAVTVNAVKGVLEMLNNEAFEEASPAVATALSGFGRSPMVRKLIRVTDSPFPLGESEDDKDNQVDKAAEEFIKRFYKELRKQT